MANLTQSLIRGLAAVALALAGSSAWALKCDVDNNARIDRIDIGLIQQAIIAKAPVTGPEDPRDADNNNLINAADSRLCVLRCRYASCATNGAPTANAGPAATVRVGERATLNGAASSDPDGDALTYAWTLTSRPAGSTAALTGASTVNPSFTADRAGNYVVQLVVNDGASNSPATTVTISTRNSAPVANAGADQTVRVGDVITLDGRASNDVDGDTLTYAWTIVTAPAGSTSTIGNPTAVQPTLRIDVAGSYELRLIVNDANLASTADTVLVSTSNTAPVARPGNNRSVALGATVQLDGSASFDVDGDTLTYAWSVTSRPAGSAAALSNPAIVNPTFAADLSGSYVVQLIVSDGNVASPAASVTITTNNAAPTANAGPDQTVPLGANVQLTGAASSDPEGGPLTYAWSLTARPSGSVAVLSSTTASTPGFVADRPGTYVAQLIVSDGTLASAPDTVIISTQNSRPVADAGTPQSVNTGSTVQLNGSASRDADGDTLAYAWSLTTRPSGSTSVLSSATAASPNFVADRAGSYVAQLIVSDASLSSTPSTVLVTVTTPNRAPVAAAAATPASVNVGQAVSLSSAGSSDPDGNPITYAWTVALRPAGSTATITSPTAASTSFVPDVAGAYTVQLAVSDGTLSSTATASLSAAAVVTNRPPVIVTTAPSVATVSAPFAYDVDAADPDAGDMLLYALTTAPAGMAINPATGLIAWTPTPAQTGSQAVVVRVTDAAGLFATQSFSVTVSTGATPLQLSATLTPAIANAGETVTLNVAVSGGNGGALTRTATLDGTTPLTLNASGVATFAAPATGVHRVNVTVSSAPMNGSTPSPQARELILTVRDASDTTAPTAAITSPAANSEVLAPVPVTGSATDAHFAYYQLLLRPLGTSAWNEIHRGLSTVTNGALGTLDPSRLSNGVYELGLNVVDVNGRATSTLVAIEVARDRKIGQFRLSFSDIRTDASGLPLMLARTYDSLKKDVSSDFGYGWSVSANDLSVRKNMVFGLQWNITTSGFNICLRPAGQRRITVTLPDGGVYRFNARNQPECGFAQVPPLNIVLDPLPLPVGGATGAAAGSGQLEIVMNDSVLVQGGNLYNADTGEPWNPSDFLFTDATGVRYSLREGVGVLSTTDLYGNTVTYGPGGIQHSASVGLQFVRDGQGRITRATDPAGRSLTYTYNVSGELSSVTDRAGQVTQFLYDTATRAPGAGDSGSQNSAHLLASIIDPRGQLIARQQFDEYGRLVGAADANGATATQTFDEANNQQRVVDRRGNPTTYTFDASGNVTRIVDARGGATDLTYDANGNELTRRDPLGHTTTKTFNAVTGKMLTVSDPLGRVTTTVYPTTGREAERQNPVSVTDPLGRVRSYGYRPSDATVPGAAPTSITEPLGRSTAVGIDTRGNLTSLSSGGLSLSYAYDTRGRRIRETDGLGNVINYTFDDNGNELTRSVTRTVAGVPRTETTTRVYDAENRLTQETDPLGAVRSATYNGAGKVETRTDALGRVTRQGYDANARLVRVDFPDGTSEQTTYDGNGNRASSTDRRGRSTQFVYDELNRLSEVQLPDGTSTRSEYDAAGRMTAEVDGRGGRTVHEYDAAGQRTATVDASGRRTEFSFDLAGNPSQTRLPDGRVIASTYDALNRLTRTDYPDGSSQSATFRPDGRKSTETDARGLVTTYGYDAAGRLANVTQSGVATATTYGYDETGMRTTQRDASDRLTQWRYDLAGRPTTRILPDGTSETLQYDNEGRVTGYVNFAGQTSVRAYDTMGRETSRTVPGADARSTTWTYTAEGKRATQVESGATSAQGTTTYTYDTLNRLTALSTPQGDLGWAYDAAGRLTQRTTPEGATTYQYDGDGRITLLTAPDSKSTAYSYDASGRQVRSEQQLDSAGSLMLVTEKRYDAQDRNVAIAHIRRAGASTTLLTGQRITRAAGGAVNRIDTFGAGATFDPATGLYTGSPLRVQTFGYDTNTRLTQENEYKGTQLAAWLANSASPATQASTYGYDAVGNRTAKTVFTPAGIESTAYVYDTNDRLQTETLTTSTGSTVLTSFTWDGNGNLASKQSPGSFTGYRFDADNRLVEVRRGATAGAATVVASYGYDADGQRVRKATPAGTTRYLIDPTTTWPQVAIESTGTQRTAYVWGDGVRQQARGTAGSVFSAPAASLVPLAGHMGTTLASVDTAGNVVDAQETSAFGEPANLSPLANHQFTGEYWDADTGLTYLRARWYAAAHGRLASPDRAQGQQNKPRTQHRYNYAGVDPVNRRDPSGNMEMSLGGLSISMNISMSQVATAGAGLALGGLIYPYVDGAVRNSIWDIMVLMKITGVVGDEVTEKMTAAKEKADEKDHKGPEAHHTVPKYLCGHQDQDMALVTYSEHSQLHAGLSAVHLFIEAAGDSAADTLNIPLGRRRSDVVTTLGKSLLGRAGIASAIGAFYTLTGAGAFGGGAVELKFAKEGPRFIGGHTWCAP